METEMERNPYALAGWLAIAAAVLVVEGRPGPGRVPWETIMPCPWSSK